jgi:N,N'-diacetyllegionaminate synthase
LLPLIDIAGRLVGDSHPALLIAEIGQAHDGSLGLAHAFIDAAAAAGADAVKFQTHIAAAESTLDEPFRVKFSKQDATRYGYWQRMEFTPEQWAGIAEHARAQNLVFLSSAFSVEAVGLLRRLDMPAWKVASGELGSRAILNAMIAAGGPFVVSSGMSSWLEIDALVTQLREARRALALMQCTSRYPTPLNEVGLNVIGEMRRRYAVPVGLSDHSGRVEPAIAAIARGANLIELHITLDRRMFGPDVAASLTIEEFRQVAEFRDALALMDAQQVDKDRLAEALAPMRELFARSLAPARALVAGTKLTAELLTIKKPGTGIPERDLERVVGRRLIHNVPQNRLLSWEDFENGNG